MGAGEQNQAYAAMTKRKGQFGILVLRKRRRTCLKDDAMGVKNMYTIGEIVLSSRRKITKEEEKKPTSPRKWRKPKRRNPRRRK